MKSLVYITFIFVYISFLFNACSNSQKLACPNFKSNNNQNLVVKKSKKQQQNNKKSYTKIKIKPENAKDNISVLAQKQDKVLGETAILEAISIKAKTIEPIFANNDNATIVEDEKNFLEKIRSIKEYDTKPEMSSSFDKVAKKKLIFVKEKKKLKKNTNNHRLDEEKKSNILKYIILTAILVALFLILSYVVAIIILGDLLNNLAFLLMLFGFSTFTFIFIFRKYKYNSKSRPL